MAVFGNIFLVGPMGAGKTTIGKRLAELRGMEFVDSDQEIEQRTGVDIPFIFEKEGEEGFRVREAKVIEELSEQRNIVLATGGGAVMNADNRKYLSARGFVVYLYATVQQQLDRTHRTDHRSLLQNGDRATTLQTLFELRDPLYREIADMTIETDGRNARTLARQIEQQLSQAVPE